MHSNAELGLLAGHQYDDEIRIVEQALRHAQQLRDVRTCAECLHKLARLHEKRLSFSVAEDCAHQALALYAHLGDQVGTARCQHTLAVWAFHRDRTEEAIGRFKEAASLRERGGDLMASAQSFHNLGYVYCRLGEPRDSFWAYREAEERLKNDCVTGVANVDRLQRDTAFVWSHLTYANAKYGEERDALRMAVRYFEHVASTGVHREQFLAYVGAGLALTRENFAGTETGIVERVEELTGLKGDPKMFFSHALREERRALAAHAANQGARLYLGTVLVTLMEFGKFLLALGMAEEGREMLAESVALAQERGWTGEARRAVAFARECGVSPGAVGAP
ncbi:MAG TPA: tetratricopeptide repeat protein [Thermoanaerobaculia bacterium]